MPSSTRKRNGHTINSTPDSIEASNATTRFLLGGAQRSWMFNAPAGKHNHTHATSTIPARPHHASPSVILPSTSHGRALDSVQNPCYLPSNTPRTARRRSAQDREPASRFHSHDGAPTPSALRQHLEGPTPSMLSHDQSPLHDPSPAQDDQHWQRSNVAIQQYPNQDKAHPTPRNNTQGTQLLPSIVPSSVPSDLVQRPTSNTGGAYQNVTTGALQGLMSVPSSTQHDAPGLRTHQVVAVYPPQSSQGPVHTPYVHKTLMQPPSARGHQAVDPRYIFEASYCLPKLDNFLAHTAGQLTGRDLARMARLREACIKGDSFYLVLSLEAAASISKQAYAPHLLSEDPAIIDQIIGGPLTCLRQDIQTFLATFPKPLQQVKSILGSASFEALHESVSTCLMRLRNQWTQMVHHFRMRNTLPLTQDFLRVFQMRSICLQRSAFQALLRETWGTDSSTPALRAYNLFLAEQNHYTSNGADAPVPTAVALHYYQCYVNLYRQHVAEVDGTARQAQQVMNQHFTSATGPTTQTPIRANETLQHVQMPDSFKRLIPLRSENVAQWFTPGPQQLVLHQAHLRDAVLRHVPMNGVGTPEHDGQFHFCRQLSGFLLPPVLLSNQPIQEVSFDVRLDILDKIPIYLGGGLGAPPTATFDSSTLLFRLRCCQTTIANPSSSAWSVKETAWPNWLYFSLNDKPIELRRKLQHGKNLPVDISRLVKAQNKLKIYANLPSTATYPGDYAIAIETISFSSKEEIKRLCLETRMIPASAVRASIISSFDKSSLDVDEDICITHSNTAIELFEPFSNSRIYDVPVRGVDCTHRNAFDLDVYLDTREYDEVSEHVKVTKTDDWKCPICRADARPQSLVVDGFLQEVRSELEKANALDTRTILVEEDGTWTAKQESAGHADEDSPDQTDQPNPLREALCRTVDVIELDSD